MRSNILISCVLINIGIQWGFFVVSAVLRTELLFELVGSCTCVLLALLSYCWGSRSLRQRIHTWLVVLWAIRLGLYLFTRKLRQSQGSREAAPPRRRKFFLLWTLQALRTLVTLFPTLLLNTSPRADLPLGVRDLAGWLLWLMGFVLETVADHQKAAFQADPKNEEVPLEPKFRQVDLSLSRQCWPQEDNSTCRNAGSSDTPFFIAFKNLFIISSLHLLSFCSSSRWGHFIRTGLWSVSRHPNYFGEILLWLGLYLSASSVFRRTEYLCVLCPITDLLLITRVTGVPKLEQDAFRKWGNDPAYHEYLRSTAVLVPFLW